MKIGWKLYYELLLQVFLKIAKNMEAYACYTVYDQEFHNLIYLPEKIKSINY